MNRSIVILFLLITTLSSAQKPNVLVFLVDDLKPSFGAYGDTL